MRRFKELVLTAAITCSAVIMQSCNNGTDITADETVSTELLRTDKSWNGATLPDYPQGQPELVAVKYVIPAGKRLGWHHHVCMNHGVLVQGELTVIGLDGQTKTIHEGDVVVEMVDSIHYGENRGKEPVVLYMFYLSQEGLPLSVMNPEVPME